MKNVINWTAKDAQNFLASYDDKFDTFTYKGFIVSFNKINSTWGVYDSYTWQCFSKNFVTPEQAKKYIDKKNI